jgi:hypothetical protein
MAALLMDGLDCDGAHAADASKEIRMTARTAASFTAG